MGLDMYLYKTAKIEGACLEEYERFFTVAHFVSKEEILNSNIPQVLKDRIVDTGFDNYKTVFSEVGYWRKFNALHNFFVKNFQDGIDECELSKPLSKESLEKVLEAVKEDSLVPTSGFFFGSTEKDDWYHKDREETILLLEKLLKETDFDKEVFFYRSSW